MDQRERLIVVGPVPPPYHGVSVMMVHLLRALEADGRVAAHLNTSDERGVHNAGRFDLDNVWLALRHALEIVRLLVRHRDAGVYVPISQNRLGVLRDAVFLVAARIARRRRYVHLHGGHFADFYRDADPLTRLIARLAVTGAHQAWVLTPGLAGMFDGLVPPERVHVLENVVEDPLPESGAPERDGDHPLRALFLSNLMPEKGALDLLAGLAAMGDEARGVEARIVGEGFDEIERRIDAEAAALRERGVTVKRLGSLTGGAKLEQLRWADALVLPTYYPLEGQPLVLLEAMAAGLAIVASRHAGIPDTVRDGQEALLHEPRDIDGLARALAELARSAELRERLGAAGRARWEAAYRPERFADDVRALVAGRPLSAGASRAAASSRSTASSATAD